MIADYPVKFLLQRIFSFCIIFMNQALLNIVSIVLMAFCSWILATSGLSVVRLCSKRLMAVLIADFRAVLMAVRFISSTLL